MSRMYKEFLKLTKEKEKATQEKYGQDLSRYSIEKVPNEQ